MNAERRYLSTGLTAAALAAASVAYVVFVFLPGQRAIAQLRRQVQEKQQFIARTQSLPAAIQQAADDLQAANDYAAAWRASAPSEARLAATLGQITQRAQQTSLLVQRFDPQPVARLDAVWQAPVAVAMEGSFLQVFEFLRAIEELPASVWIASLRLENSGRDDGRARCELTLVVFADNSDFSE
jgi:Tfp pilus assembly protein PilO